ncbi:MAG: HemK2/MTQ2 family protein methyltransferase [Candidatus Bathyarchaeia archaeon]
MRSSEKAVKRIFFSNCTFCVEENVYEPAEDTFLLAENLVVGEHDVVLDMGTGCGILGVLAAKRARKVVAVDVNPHAVRCAEMNARLNGVTEKVDIRRGDLFEPVKKGEKFDVIIFNAPYLPSEEGEQKTWIGRAWAGGTTGRQLIDRFVSRAPSYLREGGRVLLVQSTLSNVGETIQRLEGGGLHASILAEKKVAFETIVVIQAERR